MVLRYSFETLPRHFSLKARLSLNIGRYAEHVPKENEFISHSRPDLFFLHADLQQHIV